MNRRSRSLTSAGRWVITSFGYWLWCAQKTYRWNILKAEGGWLLGERGRLRELTRRRSPCLGLYADRILGIEVNDGLNKGTEIRSWKVLSLRKKSGVILDPSAIMLVQCIAIKDLAQRQTHWRQSEDRWRDVRYILRNLCGISVKH